MSEPISGAQLHYHFVESEGDPSVDPLVLWLNGGPGCSSYMGFWLEQGPFTMHGDGTLSENPFRWNTEANVLFLESPPGVGFSFASASKPPYAANDTTTAAMNLGALAAFFVRFPRFNASALWLSGESYAGVYIPMLAAAVLASNAAGTYPRMDLRGILVGNGAIATGHWYEGGLTRQRMQHAYNHGLFSDDLKARIDAACTNWTAPPAPCSQALSDMAAEMGPLNAYDIEVTCAPGASAQQRALLASGQDSPQSSRLRSPSADPCSVADEALTAYLNEPSVQEALHVQPGAAALGAWSECASGSTLSYTRIPQDERLTVYPGLLRVIAVAIYNGDQVRVPIDETSDCRGIGDSPLEQHFHLALQDECIPYIQDSEWTRGMGYAASQPWRPWFVENEVAGYVTEFSSPVRFSFITVKRAGHEVPTYQPERAQAMLQRFVKGQPL